MKHNSSGLGKSRWIITIVILIILSLAVTPLSAAAPKKEKDGKGNGNKPEVPPGHSDNFPGNGQGPPETPLGQGGPSDQIPQPENPPQENEAPQLDNELPISEPDNSVEGPKDQPSEDNTVEESPADENVVEEPPVEENVNEPEPEVVQEPVIEVQPAVQPPPAIVPPVVQYPISSTNTDEVEINSAAIDNLEEETQAQESPAQSPAPEPVATPPALGEAQAVSNQDKESSAPEAPQASPLVVQISGGTAVVFAIMSVLVIIRTLHGGIVRQTTPVRLEQLGFVPVTAVHGVLRKVKPVSVKVKFSHKSKMGRRDILKILAENSRPPGLRRR
ncbi:MAG: hypothetical protein AB1476_03965 [Candidatus Hadarchaeota archaeon]